MVIGDDCSLYNRHQCIVIAIHSKSFLSSVSTSWDRIRHWSASVYLSNPFSSWLDTLDNFSFFLSRRNRFSIDADVGRIRRWKSCFPIWLCLYRITDSLINSVCSWTIAWRCSNQLSLSQFWITNEINWCGESIVGHNGVYQSIFIRTNFWTSSFLERSNSNRKE